MKRFFVICTVIVCLALRSIAQDNNSKTSDTSSKETAPQVTSSSTHPPLDPSNVTSAKGFVLEDATPMRLRMNRTISSADAHVDDTVDFEVLQDVALNGVLVIQKGGLAFGTVTEAHPKRRMARGGKLEINLDYVKLVNGDKASLGATQGGSGGGHTGVMTAGIVATGLLFFPAAPFFLFMHGKDITIPKGAEVTAYVNGDTRLDIAKFQQPTPNAVAQAAAPNAGAGTASSVAKMQVESSPPGADIEVDGSFVGNTPSDVQVAEGEHTVVVKKAGFKDWERKLKLSVWSNVHLNAELEQSGNP